MKNKIIGLFLIITFLIPHTGMYAAAKESEEVSFESKKELVELVIKDFKLSEGEETVTRIEFLNMIMLLEGYNYSGAVSEQVFSDAAAESEMSGVLSAALARGIISAGAMFYPDEPVTYAQAVKMAAVLIGYRTQAERMGGYPSGYVQAAYNIDLLDGVQYAENKSLTVNDAYVLIYNTLHAGLPKTEDTGEGFSLSYNPGSERNILSEYHDIYKTEDTVTADSRTSLYNADGKLTKDNIRIGNDTYTYTGGEDLLGYNVRAYYRKTDTDSEVIQIYKYKNESITISSDDFSKADSTSFTYYNENDKERSLKLAEDIRIIKNSKAYYPDSYSEFFSEPSSEFEFIDNDSDGSYDVVKALCYKYVHVRYVDDISGYIYDINSSENMLDLSDDDCEYAIYAEYYNGIVQIPIEEIEENSLIAYIMSDDKSYVKATVLKDSVSGKISGINETDNEIVIDDKAYKISDYAKKYFNFKAGDEGKFYLGIDNSVVSFIRTGSSVLYGWVVSCWIDEDTDEDYYLKLYASDGVMYKKHLAENVIYDGAGIPKKTAYNLLKSITEAADPDRLIRFSFNQKDEFKMIDTGENVSTIGSGFDERDTNNSLRIFYREKAGLQYKRSTAIFGRKIKLGASTAIFAIPAVEERGNDKNFGLLPISYFTDDDKTQVVTAYDIDGVTGAAGAVLVKGNAVGDEPSDELTTMAVIEDKVRAVTEDNEPCYKFTVWQYDQTYAEYYSGEYVEEAAELADVGDIIRFEANSNRELTALSVDYDLSEKNIRIGSTSVLEYQQGYVYSYANQTIMLLQDNIDLTDADAINNIAIERLFVTTSVKNVEVAITEKNGEIKRVRVSNVPEESVRTVRSAGAEADFVVIRHRHWSGNTAVIYRYE